MKKSRTILLVTMLLLVASTCSTVLGAGYTYNGCDYEYNQTYEIECTGERTMFKAKGTSASPATAIAYTSIKNNYDSSCYMDTYVYEYSYISGYQNHLYKVGTYGSGVTIESGDLSRRYNNTSYYYVHEANCYQSPYQMVTVDSYIYTANQAQ